MHRERLGYPQFEAVVNTVKDLGIHSKRLTYALLNAEVYTVKS